MLNTGRFALVALLFLSAGCGASRYELPPLPPESTWQRVELNPVAVERNDTANFLAAKQATLQLYTELQGKAWKTAGDRLSSETRLLLGEGDGTTVAAILEAGETRIARRTFGFDPVRLLLLPGVQRIVDSASELGDGAIVDADAPAGSALRTAYLEEYESEARKELFLVDAAGTIRKIVWIREGSEWHLHMRDLPLLCVEERETVAP
jgi:hypothetical protein